MPLYVGTSGWAYKEWRGGFYPKGLPQARFLEHYGRALTACEVNATFYALQSQSTLARWAAAVPDRFRFAVKAHRRLSYRKKVALDDSTEAFAKEFLGSLTALDSKLGCLLIQFPEFVLRDDAGLEHLLESLSPNLRFACEFHDPSWDAPEVASRLAERGGTVCLRETEGVAPASLPPGPLAYVRLKAERYSDEAREALLALLLEEACDRDVYAFSRHKDVPAGDPNTGVGLAEWLTEEARTLSGPEISG
jgi:uncharacterized protein YecE (DUF72 family)